MIEGPQLPTLAIGACVVPIAEVWVHLQDPFRFASERYVLVVPKCIVDETFDPHSQRPIGKPLATFVMEQIAEFGTFIVEGYWQAILKASKTCQGPFRWVVATVGQVDEKDGGLVLCGQVIPWQPHGYASTTSENPGLD
jgi:hypothetical protein